MQPFWVLTLGKAIMKSDEVAARFQIDYYQFLWNIGCLIIPLTIGYLIQNYYPRYKKQTAPLLWWISLIYIAFNILFAFVIFFEEFRNVDNFTNNSKVRKGTQNLVKHRNQLFIFVPKETHDRCLLLACFSWTSVSFTWILDRMVFRLFIQTGI